MTTSSSDTPYEVIEHTADAGIRARGHDLPQLFVNVVKGMTHLMTDPAKIEPREVREINVEAEDREGLLVELLNEMIYLTETEAMIFGDIQIGRLTDTQLTAVASGEKIDLSKHDFKTEIKACTYHELKVEKEDSGWMAQVIFDV